MAARRALQRSLLALRLGVFSVMLVWALDKFIRPDHASAVFQHFYFSPGFGPTVSYIIGAVQLALVVGFVLGVKKRITYGSMLLLHGVSTLSSFKMYLTPYQEIHILFYAAWPMLAACYALYSLRAEDTLWTLGDGR